MLLATSSKSGKSQPIDQPLRIVICPSNRAVQYRETVYGYFNMAVCLVSQIAFYTHFNSVPLAFFDASRSRIGSRAHQVIATVVGHIKVVQVWLKSGLPIVAGVPHDPGTTTITIICLIA